MQAIESNIDLNSLSYILSKVEDVAMVLDRQLTISSATDTGYGFKLSIELVHGQLDIRMAKKTTLLYTPNDSEMPPKTIGFLFMGDATDRCYGQSFDRAFREILKIDRLNGEEDQYDDN